MKWFCLFVTLIFFLFPLFAQKPNLTDTAYRSWIAVAGGTISADGKYAFYRIHNKPQNGNSYVLTSTDNSWKFSAGEINNLNFSRNSEYCFASKKNDTLISINLKERKLSKTTGIKNYQLYTVGNDQWLILHKANSARTLIIRDLQTAKEYFFDSVAQLISPGGLMAGIIKVQHIRDNYTYYAIDLKTGTKKQLTDSANAEAFTFDQDGKQVAFITQTGSQKTIWHCDLSTNLKASPIASTYNKEIPSGYNIATDAFWGFSQDGKNLFFTLSPPSTQQQKTNPKIWSYQDTYLLSQYDALGPESLHKGENLCILSLADMSIRQLLSNHQRLFRKQNRTDVMITVDEFGRGDDITWNIEARPSYYFLIPASGKLLPIKEKCIAAIETIEVSPNGDFIIYFDPEDNSYWSCNAKTGKSRRISDINENPYYYQMESRGQNDIAAGGIAGWNMHTNHVIIQARYNLWDVDPSGVIPSQNLTGKLQTADSTIFSLAERDQRIDRDQETLILGFGLHSKLQRIYVARLLSHNFKKKYETYQYLNKPYRFVGNAFQKARDANAYLIKFETCDKSPNYVYTKDFKHFDTLSAVHPEDNFNWMTSELVSYRDQHGMTCEGILYKPQNFDPHIKYPVVMDYYMEVSHQVNKYKGPEPASDAINIPLLVSNGYIVCRPNIYLNNFESGESALASINAAADYLSSQQWIDSTKIAITGHSFGGWITNYVVTHNNRFAAAIPAAGISNLIGDYNDRWSDGGISHQYYYRRGPFRFIKGLEADPKMYIDNSPILFTKNISTPILLIHNEEDNAVPVYNSHQLFGQLRSEGKPVWLIQYDNEMHTIENEENQLDAQQKVIGFLDHYLKDKEKPDWMSRYIGKE